MPRNNSLPKRRSLGNFAAPSTPYTDYPIYDEVPAPAGLDLSGIKVKLNIEGNQMRQLRNMVIGEAVTAGSGLALQKIRELRNASSQLPASPPPVATSKKGKFSSQENSSIPISDRFSEIRDRYLPVVQTVQKEQAKLAPHAKRLTIMYNNLDPGTTRNIGVGTGVVAAGATALGLGLRLSKNTLDEYVPE